MTSNPQRKWEKKLRKAKTEEQTKKAEAMLKVLRPYPPSPPKKKNTKESDEDVFNEAQKYNKQHFKDKQQKEKQDKEVKKRSLNKVKRYNKIYHDKKVKEEQDIENMKYIELEYNKKQKQKQEFLDNVQNHKATMKVENTDKLDFIHDIIHQRTNKNKKKTKKLYNKFIHKEATMIELAIRGYMDEHNVSYEEASHKFYLQMKEPKVRSPDPEHLQILDNCAKL